MLRRTPSVFLCSACLFVFLSQPSNGSPAPRDLLLRVKTLNQTVSQTQLNSRLYTPTFQDYQKCPSAALNCFADELKVLIEELEISGKVVPQKLKVSNRLRRLAGSMKKLDSGCHQCELLQEENTGTFFARLVETLEAINTERS